MNNLSNHQFDKLPVGAFEHYFLNDDTSDYPGIFYTRVTLTGLFNHGQFEQAVKKALQRSLLLRSIIVGNVKGKAKDVYWTPAEYQPFIQWVADQEPYRYPNPESSGFDLTKEYGFRLFLREAQQQTVLLLQTHHSCVDATGSRMFIEDILAYYDQQINGLAEHEAKLRPIVQETLRRRDEFHQTPESLKKRRFIDFKYIAKMLLYQPRSLCLGKTLINPEAIQSPSSAWHEFSAAEFKTLKAAAKNQQGTINDFLLWCLFLTLEEWNRTHHSKGKSVRIRVGMAVNLRKKTEDDLIPPANVLSMYFIDRAGDILSNPSKLFTSLTEETQYVKQNLMGLTFIRFARFLGRINGGIQQLLKPRPLFSKCLVTVNTSNLGLPLADSPLLNAQGKVQAADMLVERIELLPPFRAYTHGAFGIASYDGRMVITFNYDSRTVEAQQGEAILALFIKRIYHECSKI